VIGFGGDVHPFDWRTVVFARHAQHVVLVHFPLALCITGVAFDFVAQLSGKTVLASAAYYNLLVAAVSSPLVVATGIAAWQLQLEGQRLHGVLLLHLVMGSAAAALIWLVWWMHHRTFRKGFTASRYRLPLEFFAASVLIVTGHLGGFLSGVNMPR
jgi:uncharacterized membrane protein